MQYYGSRISDNLSERPEGFLICHNVPIARTGYQDYLGSELPQAVQEEYHLNPNKIYKVYRSSEEVFDPATIASFEGMVFTDDHPPEMVTPQNIQMYNKGHLQNVRRGTGEHKNMLIADIICTDESVANAIKQRQKREVSCGYMYTIRKGPKGFEQIKIRGNHVALVDSGRAGSKAAIQDSNPDAILKQKKGEKGMKNIFAKMFAAWAKDAEPEEIEAALNEMDKKAKDEDLESNPNQGGEIEGLKKDVAELKSAMAEVTSALKQLVESDKEVHKEMTDEEKLNKLEKDSLENPEDEGTEETEKETTAQLIEQEKEEEGTDEDLEEEKKSEMASDSVQSLIKVMRPKLLAIQDPTARALAVDAFVSAVNDARKAKPKSKNNYSALVKALGSNKVALDQEAKRTKTMDARIDEQVNAINKFNPHAKKEGK